MKFDLKKSCFVCLFFIIALNALFSVITVPCCHSALKVSEGPDPQSHQTPREDASTGVSLRAAIKCTQKALI